MKDAQVVKRPPLRAWLFKGIVIRPIGFVIAVTVMLTILFVGPTKTILSMPLKVLTIEDTDSPTLDPIIHTVQWVGSDYVVFLNDTESLQGYNITTGDPPEILMTEERLAQLTGRRVKFSKFSLSYDGSYILLSIDSTIRLDGMESANYIVCNRFNDSIFYWLLHEQGVPTISNIQWSPTSNSLLFVSSDDVWLFNVDTNSYQMITTDGTLSYISNGRPSLSYRTEIFENNNALWWAPDGSAFAYLRSNESLVKQVVLSPPVEGNPIPFIAYYPLPGTPNPIVQLFVFNISTNTTTLLPIDMQYITSVIWLSPFQIACRTLNRNQDHEYYNIWDASNATDVRSILVQNETKGWIALYQPYVINPNTIAFIGNSSGYYHIYLLNTITFNFTAITSGLYDILKIVAYEPNSQTLFYLSTEGSSMDSNLFSTSLSTKIKSYITTSGYHEVTFNSFGTYCVLNYEGPMIPHQDIYQFSYSDQGVRATPIKVLENNLYFASQISGYYFTFRRTATITLENKKQLNVEFLIPPKNVIMNFPNYALLIHADGRPGKRSVTNKWQFGYDEFLASTTGIIVARVDPSGTSGRGASFMFDTYLDMGDISGSDFVQAAVAMCNTQYKLNVDPKRVGIYGTGVGGYNVLRSLLLGEPYATQPDPKTQFSGFAGGISVDPVIDWAKYVSIFSERYMRTPTANPNGYNITRILYHIKEFDQLPSLLLVYGTDVNTIHMANSIELKQSLTQAHIPFQTMYYTEWTEDDKIHYYRVMLSYFQEILL